MSQTYIQYLHDHFMQDIQDLTQQIQNSEFQPQVIVGIARGGLIPATYLSHALNVPLVCASFSLRDGMVHNTVPHDGICLRGNQVLLVDDMIDSGETITQLLKHLNVTCPDLDIRVAVLWQNTQAIQADYHARCIDRATNESWIIYPWEQQA